MDKKYYYREFFLCFLLGIVIFTRIARSYKFLEIVGKNGTYYSRLQKQDCLESIYHLDRSFFTKKK
jgi:hypothetical protein